MKHAKRIGALICVIAICFTLGTAPAAHASGLLGGQAAGAWIAAGLVALNIVAHTGAQAIGSYFGWQSAPTSQSIVEYAFPNSSAIISDYMNAATIKIDQGVTTIDGVEYDEVFVSPDTFTRGLKTNLFDFKSKWGIISGQSDITLASGDGFYYGVPIYSTSSGLKSPKYSGFDYNSTYQTGNITVRIGSKQTNTPIYWTWPDGAGRSYYFGNYPSPFWVQYAKFSDGMGAFIGNANNSSATYRFPGTYVSDPFEYTYTSGVVPAEESDIPDNFGLSLKIPHDQLQTFYNLYPQYNVDNSVINIEQDQIDIDELTQAIFDQITSMDEIKADWTAEPEPEPEPPGPAEDILEGVNTIIAQQNQQISQNQQQQVIQQQQLQEQKQISQDTSTIKDAIDSVTQMPTAEDLPDFKFDLRELFPFCIPFDIYNLLSALDAEPTAPHVQLPFVIESLNFRYDIDLDFSVFNPVAQVLRTMEFLLYGLGLAWATGKVIKW